MELDASMVPEKCRPIWANRVGDNKRFKYGMPRTANCNFFANIYRTLPLAVWQTILCVPVKINKTTIEYRGMDFDMNYYIVASARVCYKDIIPKVSVGEIALKPFQNRFPLLSGLPCGRFITSPIRNNAKLCTDSSAILLCELNLCSPDTQRTDHS